MCVLLEVISCAGSVAAADGVHNGTSRTLRSFVRAKQIPGGCGKHRSPEDEIWHQVMCENTGVSWEENPGELQ